MYTDKMMGNFVNKDNMDKQEYVDSYMESSFSARLLEGWNMCNEENE